MKSIAALALISVACASEDNELFKFNNNKVANQTQVDHIKHHPIHYNGAHNVTAKPKPLRPVRPLFFNRTKTTQANNKIHQTFDDEELFLNDEIAENELSSQGLVKSIAPVAGKILGKVLSKLDDDELFLETADNELMSKKMKQFLIANPQYMPPAPVAKPQHVAPVSDPNAEQAAPTEQAAPAFVPKKKGGAGKWLGRNKEWIAPIGEKVLDKILSKLDDELFLGEVTDNELSGQGVGKWIAPIAGKVVDKILSKLDDDELFFGEVSDNELSGQGLVKSIAPIAGKILGKVLSKLDDDELFLGEVSDNELSGQGVGKWIAPIAGKVVDKILSKLDDDELFLGEVADNELSSQGLVKSIAPVAGKILGKVLSKLDDDELFLETADNELMSKKMKQFLIANPQYMPPAPVAKPQQAAPVADPNAEQAAPTEQAAPAVVPKKKKGGPGKWIGRNKEWIAPVGGKILDKLLSALDDDELFMNDEIAENELSSQGLVKSIAPVAGKILGKVLSKLDAEDFAEDELHFLGVVGKETGKFFKKNGKTIASIGMKVGMKALPALLLDEEENELFNLGGLIKDGINIYGDIKNKNLGGLVNHGVQTVKDLKKHDDEELFSVKHQSNKSFLGPL